MCVVQKDLQGFFKWVVVDVDLVIVDPKYLSEYQALCLLNLSDSIPS